MDQYMYVNKLPPFTGRRESKKWHLGVEGETYGQGLMADKQKGYRRPGVRQKTAVCVKRNTNRKKLKVKFSQSVFSKTVSQWGYMYAEKHISKSICDSNKIIFLWYSRMNFPGHYREFSHVKIPQNLPGREKKLKTPPKPNFIKLSHFTSCHGGKKAIFCVKGSVMTWNYMYTMK